MPRRNTIVPIEAFDPRLKTILMEGCVKRVEIPCTSAKQRVALRNQIFDYRARAREQKLEGSSELYRAKVTLGETKDGTYMLIIAPRGSEFDAILDKANISEAITDASPVASSDPLAAFKVED